VSYQVLVIIGKAHPYVTKKANKQSAKAFKRLHNPHVLARDLLRYYVRNKAWMTTNIKNSIFAL